MTAIVTDLAEYRAAKLGKTQTLSALTDRQVATRIVVLEKVANGTIVLDTVPEFIRTNIFPNGYDPTNHPEDNLTLMEGEATRRGLGPQ